jgi:hypothetical protein
MPDRQLPTPSVPDLACVEGETRAEVIEWLTAYYVGDGCPWNYRVGTKAIKTAYRGFDRLDLLLASCQQIKNKQGRISNDEIIQRGAESIWTIHTGLRSSRPEVLVRSKTPRGL